MSTLVCVVYGCHSACEDLHTKFWRTGGNTTQAGLMAPSSRIFICNPMSSRFLEFVNDPNGFPSLPLRYLKLVSLFGRRLRRVLLSMSL